MAAHAGAVTLRGPHDASRERSPEMTVNNKRVFYVKYLAHEIYVDILKAPPRRPARPARERKSR